VHRLRVAGVGPVSDTAPPDVVVVATVRALLSVATVARLLDCSPRTVRRRIDIGELPAVREHGRLMVRGDDLRAYVDALERRSSGAGALRASARHERSATPRRLENPVRGMRKVPADPGEDVRPLAPAEVERIIDRLTGRGRAVALLAGHLGLRPLEIRQVRWSDFDGATLTISRARTKRSAARTRVIDVPAVTARELRAWQLESGGRGDEPIVGPLGQDGLRLWAYKFLDPVARRATGRSDVTMYTLRHSHASALHYCGWTVPDAAERMGHSAVVHMGIYAHPIKVIGAQRYRDLDDLIAEARGDLECPQSAPDNG
jgi:excisionase family DNA binding protein